MFYGLGVQSCNFFEYNLMARDVTQLLANVANKKICVCIMLLPILLLPLSCSKKTQTDVVSVEYSKSIEPFVEQIDFAEIVSLETSDSLYIGNERELVVTDNSFVLYDCMNGLIFRYGIDGKFINRIGRKGKGPQEYLSISNVQYKDSLLYVYSFPSKIMAFSLDGNLVYSKNYEPQDFGAMTFAVKEGFLTYYGYGTTNNHRFALIDDEKKTFLVPSKEKVINYTPPSSVFSAIKDSVFIIDSYSNEIKIFKFRK